MDRGITHRKVQVGNDQERRNQKKYSHSKNRGGKQHRKLNTKTENNTNHNRSIALERSTFNHNADDGSLWLAHECQWLTVLTS